MAGALDRVRAECPEQPREPCGHRLWRPGGSNCQHRFLPLADVRLVAAADCRKSRREGFARMVNERYKGRCATVSRLPRGAGAQGRRRRGHQHPGPLARSDGVYAARAKKDMYVEKPLGVAMAWAWKLREEVAANKVVFQYGTQQRVISGNSAARCELVRNGYIGEYRARRRLVPATCRRSSARRRRLWLERPTPVPADLDYEMWIGPAPMKPYTADRCTNSAPTTSTTTPWGSSPAGAPIRSTSRSGAWSTTQPARFVRGDRRDPAARRPVGHCRVVGRPVPSMPTA